MTKRKKKNDQTEVVVRTYSLEAESDGIKSISLRDRERALVVLDDPHPPPPDFDMEKFSQKMTTALAMQFGVPDRDGVIWGVDMADPLKPSTSEAMVLSGDILAMPSGKKVVEDVAVEIKIATDTLNRFKESFERLSRAASDAIRSNDAVIAVRESGGLVEMWKSFPGFSAVINQAPRHPNYQYNPEGERAWASHTTLDMAVAAAAAIDSLKASSPLTLGDKEKAQMLAYRLGAALGLRLAVVHTYGSPAMLTRAIKSFQQPLLAWGRLLHCEARSVYNWHAWRVGRSTQQIEGRMLAHATMEQPYFFAEISTDHFLAPDAATSRLSAMSGRDALLFPSLSLNVRFASVSDALPQRPEIAELLKELAPYVSCIALCGAELLLAWRPVEAHVDDRDRLHNPDGPAVLWEDTAALYSYKGVLMPAEAYMPGSHKASYANSFINAEQRRAMIEMMGQGEYIKQSGFVVIDEHPKYGRLMIEGDVVEITANHFTGDSIVAISRDGSRIETPMMVLEVTNATPEPDGTYKQYWLEVPPTCRTAHEANAATWGLTPETYSPEFET